LIGPHLWGVGGAGAADVRLLVEQHGGHIFEGHPDQQRDMLGKLLTGVRLSS
jgi:hypothetical protein